MLDSLKQQKPMLATKTRPPVSSQSSPPQQTSIQVATGILCYRFQRSQTLPWGPSSRILGMGQGRGRPLLRCMRLCLCVLSRGLAITQIVVAYKSSRTMQMLRVAKKRLRRPGVILGLSKSEGPVSCEGWCACFSYCFLVLLATVSIG
jgi:hypothetical protein